MRIIAGSLRHLILETPKGDNTRPTQDRIKETLFNMLQDRLYDIRFLDLFSGSGGIGLEAISRGASECIFVENNKEAIKCIENNIKKTKTEDKAHLIKGDVFITIPQLKGEFDIVFMDPPYGHEYEKRAMELLREYKKISEDSLIIVEADLKTDFSYLEDIGFKLIKEKTYKTNKHLFIALR
ncbi:MAG: 16S rRNA (guanine(966)-N(2))-methyltransferase RsmD [Lachnospiraceae bacterium]|nr:16S rRNA (guanine(966)-N(2))-methyltransferase RsmD [Lachnospiraceae bacterium]